jgi:hypothetical protein
MSESEHYKHCCHDGAQGIQGQQGIQGPMGPMGPTGPEGIQGLQGIPGQDCRCEPHHYECCEPEFAEVFSEINQNIQASPGTNLSGGTVLFEKSIVATPHIDISMTATTGQIKIKKSGWYDVVFGVCAALNPIPSPLPVWTFSIFKNGVLVEGSTFACMTISPEQKVNVINYDVYVHFTAGDTFTLSSTSSTALLLTSPTLGSTTTVDSAYLKVVLLKAD